MIDLQPTRRFWDKIGYRNPGNIAEPNIGNDVIGEGNYEEIRPNKPNVYGYTCNRRSIVGIICVVVLIIIFWYNSDSILGTSNPNVVPIHIPIPNVPYQGYFYDLSSISTTIYIEFADLQNIFNSARNAKINGSNAEIISFRYGGYEMNRDTNEMVYIKYKNNVYLLYYSREFYWCFNDIIGSICGIKCHVNETKHGNDIAKVYCNKDVKSGMKQKCEGVWKQWRYQIHASKNDPKRIHYDISVEWLHMNNWRTKCDVRNIYVNKKKCDIIWFNNAELMNTHTVNNTEFVSFKYKGQLLKLFWTDIKNWCLVDYYGMYCDVIVKDVQVIKTH